jgi:hypothetical protein
MQWLHEPWVRYALAPFIAGLVVAELFNRVRLSGLALIAGVASLGYLGVHAPPTLAPTTTLDRIVLFAFVGTALGLAFDLIPNYRRAISGLAALTAAALVVWVSWPAVTPSNWTSTIVPAGLSLLFAIWTTGTLVLIADFPERAGATGVALGIAVGGSALLAGKAGLADLGFAAAAAAGAFLLIQLLANSRLSCGTTFTLPLASICALVPPLTVLQTGLSWTALPLLALIPAVALVPVSESLSTRARGVLALLILGVAGAAVLALVWMLVGPPVRA